MIPIVQACSDPRRSMVVAVMASQMGKTDNLLNVAGHRIDDDPVPVLYIGPTRSNVEKIIEPRFMRMVKSAETLNQKIATGKANQKTLKRIAGVTFRLAWSGSASELASDPACIVFVDERDRMNDDISGEGDPVSLANARRATYSDGKTVVTSTPTIGNVDEEYNNETKLTHWAVADSDDLQSPIWALWQEGTRFEWAWPCPDCGEYFISRFSLLKWPDKASPAEAKHEARLACPHCGVLIADKDKSAMNARGVFVAPSQCIDQDGIVHGEIPETDCASYWVSGLCSPWKTFGERAESFLRAVRSGKHERIQSEINTGFGELFKVGGDAPSWESVLELRGDYVSGDIIEAVQVITCGVDVQKDRLYYAIRGWGYAMESWLIQHGELWGDTEHDPVWTELGQLLQKPFGDHRIRLMAIDSGYQPGDRFKRPINQVYSFCRRFRGIARPTKGHAEQDRPLKPSMIDITIRGRVLRAGIQLWHVDSDYYKSWIHARLSWPIAEPGSWHLMQDVTDDYCQQIVAEARVVKPSGKAVWQKIRKNNHYLDCEALNIAAAEMLQLHRLPARPPDQKNQSRTTSAADQAHDDGGFGSAEWNL